MWLKLEIIGLILGILATAVFLSVITFKESLPDGLFESFRGGEVGAFIAGILIVLGFISSISFIVSFLFKRFTFLWLRLLLVVIFFCVIAMLGAHI